jgi:glycosyltransferase involved in cell wall biosynthesis
VKKAMPDSSEKAGVHVGVMHPSFGKTVQWIDDFAPDNSGFVFHKVTPPDAEQVSWHSRGAVTTGREWLGHFRYALKAARRGDDVVVTNFPQLAFAVCFWKRLLRKRFRLVAWSFNVGSVASARKGRIAGLLLSAADLLIVHSREEIDRYAVWLGLPKSRFLFVPLQRGTVGTEAYETGDRPFLVSLGSAGRDYRTLFAAVAGLDLRVIVVAKPEAVAGLDVPPNVEVLNGLSLLECQSLAARAEIGVVPVSNLDTASGQVTFLMLMALGVPLIVTDCPGSKDYVRDGHDALTVPPGDAEALRRAITRVWRDDDLRTRLAENAVRSWREHFSDEAAGENLVRALRTVVGQSG